MTTKVKTTTVKTTTLAALVPIDHDGAIYRRGQVFDVEADIAASLLDRGLAPIPGAPVEQPNPMRSAFATVPVEPQAGPPPLPAGLVEIKVLRGGAYAELGDARYADAGTRWLVAPMLARELTTAGAARLNGGDA